MSKETLSLLEIAYSRYLTREQYKEEFLRVFRVSLDKRFFNNLTGFDVLSFDKFIDPKDGENTITAIQRIYGQDGVNVIQNLMTTESSNLKHAGKK